MMEIALALGGGGVKGNAHIGVLRVLMREGFRIRVIAGTSAGGLWGSLFAAGLDADQIEEGMSSIDTATIYSRQPGDGPAMMGLAGIIDLLEEVLGDITFTDLSLPFAVTAVDLDRAEEVTLDQGRVIDAVLATIAVPGVFPPRKLNGRVLIDGGILNPVPVTLARKMAPDLPVVAVVLSPALDSWDGPVQPRMLNSLPFLATYLARLRIAQALNIFMRSIDISGAMFTELRLQLDHPDVIIRPDVPHIGLLDEVDVHEVALLGELATEAALPDLYRAVSWRGWVDRQVDKLRVARAVRSGLNGG